MVKLIGLTHVCLIIVSLAMMIPGPAHASPVSTSPFMKADIDNVADGSPGSGTEDHSRTASRNQIESTSSVLFVIDDTIPAIRSPWLPAGSELLIIEDPLSEPPGLNRETDATGVLLMYDE